MPKAGSRKRSRAAPEPRGFTAQQLPSGPPPASFKELVEAVAPDGGTLIGSYREPLGGEWQVLAALPLDRVEPTPYQRDLSETHVARLAQAIEKLGRYLDPIVAVRAPGN